ncbi:autotransporter assembly complex protein TamB [Budvicia diplopodorum]|uniref:autotransporter assembly complex protein TamB n=1 Tax=Budvicia diplopodorum TaxID=1119056 RepID=UPI0013591A37|nr:translocation/assembly module TamB domain-containing protein [Budvicia diplopodorum]
MKWVKRIAISLVLLVVLLIGALAGLLGSQTGLLFTIKNVPRFVPGLQVANVEGSWRNLTLSQINYSQPGLSVAVGELHLSVNFTCLSEGKVCVNAVTAKDIDVKVDSTQMPVSQTPETQSDPVTDIQTPYPIELSLLRLNNVSVTVDDIAITLDEFRSGARWQKRDVTLLPTNIRQLLVVLPKTEPPKVPVTVSTPEEPQTTGERLKALFDKPLLESLPDVRLPVDINLQSLLGENLRLIADSQIQIDRLTLQAITQDSHIQIQSLEVNAPEGMAAVSGDISLKNQWPVNLTLNGVANVEPLKGQKAKLSLSGNVVGRLMLGLNLSGPVAAQLSAETELTTAGLPLQLTLDSQKVQWPLTGKSEYQLNNTRLRLNGKATDYALSLRSSAEGTGIPPASLLVDGKGNIERFTLSRLQLSALQGNAELSGVVDWSKAISWNSLLTIDGVNTAKQWPQWPAQLNGKVTTRGSVYGGSWQIDISDIDLSGNIKQNRLLAKGSAWGNDSGQWVIPGFNLTLGPNTVDIKGDLSDQWLLDANINAPKLTGMMPGLDGVAVGTVRLSGSAKAPQLVADLTASGLRWQALSIARVRLNSDVVSAQQVSGSLNLQVNELKQGELNVSLLNLDAKGNEQHHQLELNIDGKPVSGQLALNGSFDRQTQRWIGTLSKASFDTPVGDWGLTRDVALGYSHATQTISVGPHCWRNPNAELCVPKAIEAGPDGQASIVLNRFDLTMLDRLLDKDTKVKGIFTGNADVSWKADGLLPQAKLTLAGNGVAVTQMVEGYPLPIAFDVLKIDANMNGNRAQLNWLMKVANNGSFNGDVQISDPQGQRNLSGNVIIDGFSLALIKPILVKGEIAEGSLNANLRLGGNIQSPRILGSLSLDKLRLNSQWVPLTIKQGNLALNFNGTSSNLTGQIQTENGALNLGGNADWQQPAAWRASITAKGDRIRVAMPPTIMLDMSPDVVFEAMPQLLALNGSVTIPWARISVQDVPESATGVSPDEVMLDQNLQPIAPRTAAIPISSNLVINVGDNVAINAFGLKAHLQGSLKVAQDKKGLGLSGQINIPKGQFRAYGQDLVIQKGVIQFAGPPDQPLLDLEAIRNPDSTADGVTAGVRVTGLASEPHVEIFSDPAMSQQAALSYLLRGQGLDSRGGDSDMMTSMLIGLGVAKSGKLVGQIGDAFGVKNLSLDTQGVGDSSAVVVSGYITQDLQVKYGVGIFDSLATLTLRYRLMPRLYLEAVSGLDQALDLLYQFEF